MSKKLRLRKRIDFVTRNLVSSLDATDSDVRDLADRVAVLERQYADRTQKAFDSHTSDFRSHLADAVIRELGLEQEFSIGDDDGGRVLWLAGEEPITPRSGEVVESRWVSPWVADDE